MNNAKNTRFLDFSTRMHTQKNHDALQRPDRAISDVVLHGVCVCVCVGHTTQHWNFTPNIVEKIFEK